MAGLGGAHPCLLLSPTSRLAELPPLAHRNPTAEVLAEQAFLHLKGAALEPAWVKIREKANYWALCRRGATR